MTENEKLIDRINWSIKEIDCHIENSLERITSYVFQLNEIKSEQDKYRKYVDHITYKDICAICISVLEDIRERNGLLFALRGLEGDEEDG